MMRLGVPDNAKKYDCWKRSSYFEYRRCGRHVTGHRPLHEDSRDVKISAETSSEWQRCPDPKGWAPSRKFELEIARVLRSARAHQFRCAEDC